MKSFVLHRQSTANPMHSWLLLHSQWCSTPASRYSVEPYRQDSHGIAHPPATVEAHERAALPASRATLPASVVFPPEIQTGQDRSIVARRVQGALTPKLSLVCETGNGTAGRCKLGTPPRDFPRAPASASVRFLTTCRDMYLLPPSLLYIYPIPHLHEYN